ncbi:extensin-like isoform X2 [Zingiber officinale]|uniref:extensin-like isoform X2 n=1 Tax=Zingiber officinale TaxID=94328 RepID=UPI001C4CD4D2|nr:extensin-like isoform X2 [Zingiber officinale]
MESWRQLSHLVCFILLLLLLVESAESRSLRRDGERHKVKALSHLGTSYETSDPYYYAGSPFSMPPYGDAMGPGSSSAQDYPPFCIYPPLTPLPPTMTPYLPSPPPPPLESTNPPEFPVPSPPVYIPGPPETVPIPPVYEPNPPTAVPSPTGFVPSPPPPSFTIPGTPGFLPSPPPPSYIVPGTPELVPFPPPPPPPQPIYVFPTPPGFVPSPPEFVPSPPEFVPGPPIFLPPVVYPSPLAPPPQVRGRWCVAKPSVPDPIIQEAMNYACGSGADCDSIQPSGPCYEPNTMIGHASFAFNGYWQRTKVAGGTCDFGGTAMLVTKDPSYDGCHFIIY